MSTVAYIDYSDEGNDAAMDAIEVDADPGQVVYRKPALFQAWMADPLETTVYALDASAAVLAALDGINVTPISIDTLIA